MLWIVRYFYHRLFYLMYSRAACAAKMADGNDPVAYLDADPDRNGSSDDIDEPHCSADTPPKKRPRPQYKTKWQQNWASKYPCITKKSETLAECSVCFRAFNFDHQGERLGGANYIKCTKELEKVSKIDEMFKQKYKRLRRYCMKPYRARDPLNCVTSDN